MSSSTSNSKNEWKVLLVVVLAVAVCETGVRMQAANYANERHHRDMPRIAASLNAAPAPRFLFLGNSMTRRGVRPESVEDELAKKGLAVGGIAKINPDGSVVSQWYYLYDRFFAADVTDEPPQCVVVSFVGEFLSDQTPSRSRRTALVVAGPRQIVDVLRHDAESFDDGADFVAACFLRSVAYQENVKDRVLGSVVPGYKVQRQRLNHLRRAEVTAARGASGQEARYSYVRLRRLLDRMKESNTRGVFCLMPIPGEPLLDEELVRKIEQSSMTIIDFRGLYSRTEGHYPDNYHMDSFAADIYSRAVADALMEHFPNMFQNATASPVNAM